MKRFVDQDLHGVEFRECDLSESHFLGVVMRDVEIDGLVSGLVVNGVEVMDYVEAELDRRYPVRRLLRSDDPADLRDGQRQLREAWDATIERIRSTPGVERRSINDEWSALQTLRHLVFVHDSWFRRCCLGSTSSFTSIGLSIEGVPRGELPGLDPGADPSLEDVVAVRAEQAAELSAWLEGITREELAEQAPVPDGPGWPPYARGRSVRQCLSTVLDEELEHHRFCVRDLDRLGA